LAALRVIGGIGFGAAGPNAIALASEWVPLRLRTYVVALLALMGWLLVARGPAAPAAPDSTAEPAAPVPAPQVPAAPAPTAEATGGDAPSASPTAPTPSAPQAAPTAPKESAEPAAKPSAAKTPAKRSSTVRKSQPAPSDDVSAARDALRALEREPVLKVKPSKDGSGDDAVLKLVPADSPPLSPPAPGE
jgi:hypothetical protein